MLLETQSMVVTDEGQRFATVFLQRPRTARHRHAMLQVVFLLSALFCTVASSLYHLFGGILSQHTYNQLYNLDINGIRVAIAGSSAGHSGKKIRRKKNCEFTFF